ncbi:MAG: 30S ribosomal protein S2, partial [Flavobacteriaceae bacterium]|nr:30S ribosomal protein S2 [Flavobacteriaceae bacterium]
ANGGKILFVGTKFQARDIIAEEAERSSNFYVNLRWLGGMLTNFSTIKQSIAKLKKLEEMAGPDNDYPGIIKKEAVQLTKDKFKLSSILGGIRDLRKNPAAIFIVDINREIIALQEANKLGIPVIAVVDTNCDPRGVDYVIPGNDDSEHCIRLYASIIASASLEGKKIHEAKVREQKQIDDANKEKAFSAKNKKFEKAKTEDKKASTNEFKSKEIKAKQDNAPKAEVSKDSSPAPKVEAKADVAVKTEEKVEPKAEAKAEEKVEPKAEAKAEEKVEPKAEAKAEEAGKE